MNAERRSSRSMGRQFRRDYLIISIIPLVILLAVTAGGIKITRDYLSRLILKSTNELNTDAERNLQALGEKIIRTKARDVAKEIGTYFRMHPDESIQQMRKDPFFMHLALQKVGATGYTALTEAHTYLFRVHPNVALDDRDMRSFAKEMPSWFKIIQASISGKEASGYYNWIEPDGSVRRKFMVMTPVKVPLHGATMIVAATTYIDEFSKPIVRMKSRADGIVQQYQNYINRQAAIFGIVAALIILATFSGTYFFGRRSAFRYILPIMRLSETARDFGEGRWDFSGHEQILGRKDEIGVLARAFSRLSEQLKELFSRLEQRVAELKRTQIALKESEAHYRSLFEGVPVGLYRSLADGTITEANSTLVSMLGYPDTASFMALNAAQLYAESADRADWQSRMAEGAGIHTFESRMRKYDGSFLWVEDHSRAVLDESGRLLYYEGSLKDMTERRQAEEALKKSEENFRSLYEESKRAQELYRSLINSSADAIMIYDLEGRTTYASPMFTQIFDWTAEELGQNDTAFLPESEKEASAAALANVMQSGTPCQGFETRRRARNGRLVDVSISASRYDDHLGRPAGMLVILRDISERKRLENHLQHVERMEAIGTLAGGIAHDFNNLMMVIQGSVSLLMHATDPSHPHFKDYVNIEKQVQRATKLTSQLLGYARKGRYEIRLLNLNGIIRESAETLRRTRKDISVHYDLASDLGPVEADVYQIEQTLMNLYINASDAMAEGGELFLKTMNVSPEAMRDKPYEPKADRYVMMSVRDTGTGMAPKVVDRIFEPFFTTKEMGRGTGLGLASVYGIIKGHGGYIDVASEMGKGTTFTIFLPSSEKTDPSLQAKIERPVRGIAKGHGTILLIDDEELVLEIGTEMLQSLGYEVLPAGNGRTALEMLEAHHERIDLVVLDMIMPNIGGGQLFDQIREMHPTMAVLLSSGYSIDGKAADILKRGCNGFIQKPYSLQELSDKVGRILGAA